MEKRKRKQVESEENEDGGLPWSRGRGGASETDGGEIASGLDVAWKIPSRSIQGRITEKKVLKRRGAKVHPNSGAGRIKDDGSDQERLYEVKDAVKTHTLKAEDLRSLRVRAAKQGKAAVYIVKFPGFELECTIFPERGREYE